jgi:phospholipid/cholesterol/gamma-HCH transport system permease protein
MAVTTAPRPDIATTPGGPRSRPRRIAPLGQASKLADTGAGWLEQVAGMMLLTGKAAVATFTPPYSWKEEFIEESFLILRRCLLPMIIAVTAFGFGAPGLQAANLTSIFGSVDREGAFFVMASVREVVTPRFLALGIITPLMNLVALLFGVVGGWAASVIVWHISTAGYLATFSSNFSLPDLLGSVLKTTVFGFIIAIACCYKGMNVKGGAEGVGRAVNQAVVISFAGIWVFNYMFTSILLAAFPETANLH